MSRHPYRRPTPVPSCLLRQSKIHAVSISSYVSASILRASPQTRCRNSYVPTGFQCLLNITSIIHMTVNQPSRGLRARSGGGVPRTPSGRLFRASELPSVNRLFFLGGLSLTKPGGAPPPLRCFSRLLCFHLLLTFFCPGMHSRLFKALSVLLFSFFIPTLFFHESRLYSVCDRTVRGLKNALFFYRLTGPKSMAPPALEKYENEKKAISVFSHFRRSQAL